MFTQTRAEWIREVDVMLKEGGFEKYAGRKRMNLAATAFILAIDVDQVRRYLKGRPVDKVGKDVLVDKAEVFAAYKERAVVAS